MTRVLYLPIYEPGSYHQRSLDNKHGLRSAFEAVGECLEFDYLAYPPDRLFSHWHDLIIGFEPSLIFTQIQGPTFTPEQLREIRQLYGVPMVNWNGDYWPHGLTSPEMLALLREIDLQLVVNGSVLETYRTEGVRAAFFPFGYETPNRPLPAVNRHEIVYLGNAYNEWRRELYDTLRSLPFNTGIYGNGWPAADGECTYDFTYGEALYKTALIAISDNRYTDAAGYLSNRPFQAMVAGCCLFQQYVPDLEQYTGLKAGVHYVEYKDTRDLPVLIAAYMAKPVERKQIAERGQRFVRDRHSWDVRVQQLLDELLPEVARG